MIGMLGIHQDRHLVRPERSLDLEAIDNLGSRSNPWAISAQSSASAAEMYRYWSGRSFEFA